MNKEKPEQIEVGESLYEKSCKGKYLAKYAKNGNLIREAEQFESSHWVVWEYDSKTKLDGEYTNKEFEKLRRYF